MVNFSLKEETYQIIGLCMEVQKTLGYGFLEIIYKDAMELEFSDNGLLYSREDELAINYKGRVLKHKFFADFVVDSNIIVEIKAAEGAINDEYIAQTLNYLKASGCKVGLIVNFGRKSLEYKRLVF